MTEERLNYLSKLVLVGMATDEHVTEFERIGERRGEERLSAGRREFARSRRARQLAAMPPAQRVAEIARDEAEAAADLRRLVKQARKDSKKPYPVKPDYMLAEPTLDEVDAELRRQEAEKAALIAQPPIDTHPSTAPYL
ncbi:hypothetical protein [Rathayibacter sp. AY1H2]|uniref:hypothetical protein n=1 Tax=Rathayibacter sp. AY1H2 TaxID=2080566 RepID=UPI0011AFF288|nr:hypothetical protein [Rathayibacter sp. AY1H2]